MGDGASAGRKQDERAETGGSMLQDLVVRRMAYAALGLVILFLATVAGALVTGVGKASGPLSAREREVVVTAAQVKSGGSGAAWAPYIDALIAAGDLGKARVSLDAARASTPATTLPELELSEARLELAQKRYEQAAEAAGIAMKGFEGRTEVSTVTAMPNDSAAADHAEAALVRAYAFVGLSKWKDAVALFDVYLAQTPTAADILIDRGNAKASDGDKQGAEKDFREALRFVPYDKEAQAGLKRIGAAR